MTNTQLLKVFVLGSAALPKTLPGCVWLFYFYSFFFALLCFWMWSQFRNFLISAFGSWWMLLRFAQESHSSCRPAAWSLKESQVISDCLLELQVSPDIMTLVCAVQASGRRWRRRRAEPGGVGWGADLPGHRPPAAPRQQRPHHHAGADPPHSIQYVLFARCHNSLPRPRFETRCCLFPGDHEDLETADTSAEQPEEMIQTEEPEDLITY